MSWNVIRWALRQLLQHGVRCLSVGHIQDEDDTRPVFQRIPLVDLAIEIELRGLANLGRQNALNLRHVRARGLDLSNMAVGHLGVTIEPIEVQVPEDFEKAFVEISKKGLQGVIVTQDGLIYNEQPRIRLALQHKLPLIGYSREMAVNGALMSYGPNNAAMFRRAGAFVDKILKGTKGPADLPVEQPTTFELLIHMKTANAIGVDMSPTILSRADEVIE